MIIIAGLQSELLFPRFTLHSPFLANSGNFSGVFYADALYASMLSHPIVKGAAALFLLGNLPPDAA